MSVAALLPFVALGVVAGTLAGLLGIGGGIVIVPGLALLLADGTVPAERLMQFAVGTSLATIVATSLASIAAHHRRGAVAWAIAARLAPGIVAGAVAGALLADAVTTSTLALAFGAFLLAVAYRLALPGQPAPRRRLPGRAAMAGFGAGIGTLSALLGIGGGTMTVPLLAWHNVRVRTAVGTAAACGLPIALAGAATFVAAGRDVAGLPAAATGYVYWPAFAAIVPATVAFAPLGARLAHAIPELALRRVFAVFVAAVGVRMLIG